MADATSPLLQLLLQETGGNNNNWGVLLNQGLQKIEDAIAGVSAIATTGGSVTLSDDQARPGVLFIQGILTSAAIINVPERYKSWLVVNATSGAFDVSVKCVSEPSGYFVDRGSPELLWCNGTTVNIVGSAGQVPVGTILNHGGSTVPANYLEADGTTISRTTYGRLFAKIGTAWGVGDGTTTFNKPTASNRYPRGRTTGLAVGTLQDFDTGSHTHAGSAAAVGDHIHTIAGVGDHNHGVIGATSGTGGGGGAGFADGPNGVPTTYAGAHTHGMYGAGAHSHTIYIGYTGGAETRPYTYVTLPIVRYQ